VAKAGCAQLAAMQVASMAAALERLVNFMWASLFCLEKPLSDFQVLKRVMAV
jgi:hypothetical protein